MVQSDNKQGKQINKKDGRINKITTKEEKEEILRYREKYKNKWILYRRKNGTR